MADIIQVKDIPQYQAELGSKTITLAQCHQAGYTVPPFVALPVSLSHRLFSDQLFRRQIATQVQATLKSELYAVRSSGLTEDNAQHSLAGQFTTKTKVHTDNLADAILAVLTQAHTFLHGALDQFSLIIQEYIAADSAGVVFTRNPRGGREMIIEYAVGEGEHIVSGVIRPDQLALYWNADITAYSKKLPWLKGLITTAKQLEKQYDHPQDIEWCIKQNQLYILQTRPITTLTAQQYQQILFLDATLPRQTKFYYEKTELSEIAPRPTTWTLDLLYLIYSQTGPVQRIYQKYGVHYYQTDFLKVIGNELYVDKEWELHTLLPTYSYLSGHDFKPRLVSFKKIWPTLKNLWKLNTLPTQRYNELFALLKTKLQAPFSSTLDLHTMVIHFLTDYELIFETNLLASVAIKKLNALLKNEPVHLPEIIAASRLFIDLKTYDIPSPAHVLGNSLDILDNSNFVAITAHRDMESARVERWWEALSTYNKSALKGQIRTAVILHRLREYGRWLTVQHVTQQRMTLLKLAQQQHWPNQDDIFFAHITEIESGKIKKNDCAAQKILYSKYNGFTLPPQLTDPVYHTTSTTIGVSSGLESGRLLRREHIADVSPNQKIILYTELLTPDLTQYFDKIRGIVSHQGGLLSHLAILAREHHLPVIVNFDLKKSNVNLGDQITINGDTGEVTKP